MKVYLSRIATERRVYFGDADSFTIRAQGISAERLLTDLKLAALLYDRVILSSAYFWASPTLRSIFFEVEPLIANGAVLPYVRSYDLTRDVVDYFDTRLDEAKANSRGTSAYPLLQGTVEEAWQRRFASDLAASGTCLYLDGTSISSIFRTLWLKDVGNRLDLESVGHLGSSGLSPSADRECDKFLRAIAALRPFTRAGIAEAVMMSPFGDAQKLWTIQRASDLYLTANAIACGSNLLHCRAPREQHRSRVTGIGPLEVGNTTLFRRVLGHLGIETATVARMSAGEVLVLRASPEFRRFLDFYLRLVTQVHALEVGFSDAVLRRMSSKHQSERIGRQAQRLLKGIKWASAAFFNTALGASLADVRMAPVAMAGSAATATASYLASRLSSLNEAPVLDLVEYMTQRRYSADLARLLIVVSGRTSGWQS